MNIEQVSDRAIGLEVCSKQEAEINSEVRCLLSRITAMVDLFEPVLDTMCDNRGLASAVRSIGEAICAFAEDGRNLLDERAAAPIAER